MGHDGEDAGVIGFELVNGNWLGCIHSLFKGLGDGGDVGGRVALLGHVLVDVEVGVGGLYADALCGEVADEHAVLGKNTILYGVLG